VITELADMRSHAARADGYVEDPKIRRSEEEKRRDASEATVHFKRESAITT
jgi:hypothetical protein